MENKKYKNSLYLLVESNFGALERVIGTFTLRGFQIDSLYYSLNNDNNLYDLKLSLNCTDQDLEKLVKILHNQIHVIEIKLIVNEKNKTKRKIPLAS